MNRSGFHLVFVSLFILVSCSPYQLVSLSNFREYEVSPEEITNLSFVLKKKRLHYSYTDRRYIINNYDAIDSEPYERHNMHILDNIVIPNGAQGSCICSDYKNFIIDFGEGIQVSFNVGFESNRAKDELVVDERVYRLSKDHHKAQLYFNPGNLRH